MVRSMTAFARQQLAADWGTLTWELKSVNQRFLEPSFRMPESFRHMEFDLRNGLRKSLSRGKIEANLRIEYNQAEAGKLKLDHDLASELLTIHQELQTLSQESQSPNLMQLMRWPNILQSEEADADSMEKDVKALFHNAIEQLIEVRQREGEDLAQNINDRLDGIEQQVATVTQLMPQIIQWQKDKIKTRFEEAKIELDSERVEQEMVMLAQKLDVAEELDRLTTHIKEARRLIAKGGAVGRRLDFLMQEFNREANTLGSKSINSETTASAVEMKVLIEQMREQVQNME
ncbi:YicC/YloC family endoribonuclease [Kangiella sp. HZ709]|uniref:YicC/YloC family endoribonuclease n=1 Tax=Kangiella sp. HZ709 TaxID=2666328 RepID=UPI0012AFDB4D|nr:YicC/YloC family endoribonuclease [Kangiella sp. HZ709]MRX27921.1 YicC family protein [Kangiella sp. HZ709]